MAIMGVNSIIYGTDKVEECIRFYDDFGLMKSREGDWGAEYKLAEGSTVVVRHADDPSLPPVWSKEPGVREIVWGVSDKASLNAIEAELSKDREVRRDDADTLHTSDDQGIAIGFRIFDRKVPKQDNIPHNVPSDIHRKNQHRKWYKRADPKLINHVVFGCVDIDKAVEFYTKRLNFRVTDISRGLGVFLRCDGRTEHHNLFFLQSGFLNADDSLWHHVCFGVENIDEIMAGANQMQKLGYTSPEGIGRHRIASALFYYLDNPAGGTSEYGADTDHLDDSWKPRIWEPMFGNFFWVGKWPEWAAKDIEWDVKVVEGTIPRFSELSKQTATN